MHAVETRTIAKVSKRLVPFLIVCYFVAYLDRVNVGFAALTMLSQTAFGFGAGIFLATGIVLMLGHDDSLKRATAAAE
jgi:MFS transporter, ACS family, tartrate transporter